MRASLRRLFWFRPVTCWAAVVGAFCLAYVFVEGPSDTALVRAVAGGWLLLTVAFTASIRNYYSEANKRAREPDRGALPRHVRDISASYMLALVFIVVELWSRAGEALSWRIPLAVLIGVQGIRGLAHLIDFERRRTYVIAPFVTDLRGSPRVDRRG